MTSTFWDLDSRLLDVSTASWSPKKNRNKLWNNVNKKQIVEKIVRWKRSGTEIVFFFYINFTYLSLSTIVDESYAYTKLFEHA